MTEIKKQNGTYEIIRVKNTKEAKKTMNKITNQLHPELQKYIHKHTKLVLQPGTQSKPSVITKPGKHVLQIPKQHPDYSIEYIISHEIAHIIHQSVGLTAKPAPENKIPPKRPTKHCFINGKNESINSPFTKELTTRIRQALKTADKGYLKLVQFETLRKQRRENPNVKQYRQYELLSSSEHFAEMMSKLLLNHVPETQIPLTYRRLLDDD